MSEVAHPLGARVLAGDVRALARLCRLVDDGVPSARQALVELFPHTGKAWTIGITGTPGAGKSTLTDKLIGGFRARGLRVAVLAIDPTSPFTGGAILGDRIRMQRHHADAEVFIRSVATRGALGGLSRSAADIIRLLDAWQAAVVLVETVGVGQDELEVTRTVDTTIVVTAPGMGDEVQAIKAGILECADVFAVNKADREGADATMRDLELMLALGDAQRRPSAAAAGADRHGHHGAQSACGAAAPPVPAGGAEADGSWRPPIVRCVATRGEGVDELLKGLDAHRAWLATPPGEARRRARLADAVRLELRSALLGRAEDRMHDAIEEAVSRVARREIDPYSAADALVARLVG
jgi:LAO/AO transport system kinase